jgi:hypothetical protein
LQVLVAQLHHEFARLRQAARRYRRFLLDIKRRDRGKLLVKPLEERRFSQETRGARFTGL